MVQYLSTVGANLLFQACVTILTVTMERKDLERASSSEKEPIILASLGQDAETVPVENVDNKSRCRWWIWFIPCSLFLLLLLRGGLWVVHIRDQKRYQCSAEAVPSPRQEPWCVAFNRKLSKEVAGADAGQVLSLYIPFEPSRQWQNMFMIILSSLPSLTTLGIVQGYELLFYGDSITETWRGTDMGRPCSRCQGAPEVFDNYFGSKYKAEVLAVGGEHPRPAFSRCS